MTDSINYNWQTAKQTKGRINVNKYLTICNVSNNSIVCDVLISYFEQSKH